MRCTRNTTTLLSVAAGVALVVASCGGSDASSEADVCAQVQEIADVFARGDDATTQEEALEALDDFAAALEDFAAIAPSEIKDEAEVLAEGTELLAESDPDEPSEEALAVLEDDAYNEAGDALEDFALETCDINLG